MLKGDIDEAERQKREHGMMANLKKEYIRELDNYKGDVFKRENIYIVSRF
jgi:hypothetical protein